MNVTDVRFSYAATFLITTMFCVLVALSTVGNLLVMYVILRNRGMRTVTNYFLFNLSAADLLTFLQILPNVHYAITGDWVFGIWFCRLSQFFTAFNIAISVFTFIGITADRYTAIMFPLRPRASPRTTVCFIVVIWAVAFLVGLPGLLVADIVSFNSQLDLSWNDTINGTINKTTIPFSSDQDVGSTQTLKRQCIFDWSPEWEKAYDFMLFALMYALPLLVLTATYVPISIRLWFHHEIGEVTRAQVANTRSKRRAVKMMCVVMLIFAICWLPYQLFFLVLRVSTAANKCPYLPAIFITCYWLAMSNSGLNPLIYFTMNRRFRNGLFTLCSSISCLRCLSRRFQSNRKNILNSADVLNARTSSCSPPEHRLTLQYTIQKTERPSVNTNSRNLRKL